MNSIYYETYFRIEPGFSHPEDTWPLEFSIISAYATTGEQWSKEENEAADQKLKAELQRRTSWLQRLVGYSPTSGHAEPSWAAAISHEEACNLGLQFKQDAIYHVIDGFLYVSYCDNRRGLAAIGQFQERVHVSEERENG